MAYSTVARSLPFVLTIVVGGCASAQAPKTPPNSPAPPSSAAAKAADPAETLAKIARWRAWEPKQLPKQRIQFADIGMTGEIEAATEPKISCQTLDTGGLLCSAVVDLGKDADGTPRGLSCSAFMDRAPLPLGLIFKGALGDRTLEELPTVEVETNKQRVVAQIIVPSFVAQDGQTIFGTTKVAVAYGPGYTLACEDNGAGASAAFKRISSEFFASASFGELAITPLFRHAFKHRRGDTVLGFVLAHVFKEEDGYFEAHTRFELESTGKGWLASDSLRLVERDEKGEIDSFRWTHWQHGAPPLVLTATPGESGRMRIKLEAGEKHDSLELTPEAPLSTELWEAPKLLALSSGKTTVHRYGFPAISPDGEPTIAYSTLTRVKPGLLVEQIENKAGGRRRKPGVEPAARNEISIDERGFSTKQVSPSSIYERILVQGELVPATAKRTPRGAR